MPKHWKARTLAAAVVSVAAMIVPIRAAVMAAGATCSPSLQSVSLSPASVPGGAPSVFTATLTCATPTALTIGVKGFTGANVPATLHVAAGKAAGSVTVTTATTKTVRKGWIVATLGKVSHEKLLTVGVTPRTCGSPSLRLITVSAPAYVGEHPVLQVGLTCAVSAAVHVSLKSSNADLPVPATATVGKYYSSVYVQLTPGADPAGAYVSTISVHYGSKALSKTITVYPGLSAVHATSSNNNYDSVDLEIQLTGKAPSGGTSLNLTSSNGAIQLPGTYVVPAGAMSGDVPNVHIGDISSPVTVTLSATLNHRTLAATVTLSPPVFGSRGTISLTWGNGATVLFGNEQLVNGYIALSAPAPAGGLVFTLTPGNPALIPDATVTVQAGDSNGYFSMQVAPDVPAPIHTTLTATGAGASGTIPITIEPGLSSLTGVPGTVTGGDGFTATVTMQGTPDQPVQVGLGLGTGVQLLSPLWATVTIEPGQTSASYAFTTDPVSKATQISFTASAAYGADLGSYVILEPPPGS